MSTKEKQEPEEEGCDGECRHVNAWCPECDRVVWHRWISDTAIECTECQEISEPIVSGNTVYQEPNPFEPKP